MLNIGPSMRKFASVMCVVLALETAAAQIARSEPVKLAERTPIKVALMETLISGNAKVGQEVQFEVREDIYGPNRELLVLKGAQAYGEVTVSKKRGMFGKSGKLEFTCAYAKAVDGTKVSVRSSEMKKSGKGNSGTVIATALFLSVLGVFINGRDVKVDKGQEFTVYVDNDVAIDPSKGPSTGIGSSNATVIRTSGDSQNYTIAVNPQSLRDLAQKIGDKVAAEFNYASTKSVAIMDFELIPERDNMRIDRTVARNVREDLSTAMSEIKGLRLVERGQMSAALSSLKLDSSGIVDTENAKKLGKMVSADYVLCGSVSDRGSLVVINARMIDTQSGEIKYPASVEIKR